MPPTQRMTDDSLRVRQLSHYQFTWTAGKAAENGCSLRRPSLTPTAPTATGGCTPELVRALMRALGLVACQPRPWRHNLSEPGPAGPIPDLLARDFTADAPGTKMVAADPARGVAGSAAVGGTAISRG